MAASPKALYKRASKLLQRCGCDSKHDAPALEALKQCTLLEVAAEGDSLSAAPACCHDIDLGPDEPAYVIAWAHLQSAKLFSKPGAAPQRERLDAACVHLASCLAVFPSYVAAHTAAAQLWYHVSDSSQALDGAVGHLRAALAAAEQVEAKDGGLLLCNSVCAEEVEESSVARRLLSLILCQRGEDDGDEEASAHLRQLGFRFRLSREVLAYNLLPTDQQHTPRHAPERSDPSSSSSSSSSFVQQPYVVALDGVLPAAPFAALAAAFSPASPFWSEHSYGRVGYFSYCQPLHPGPGHQPSLMSQLSCYLHPLVAPHMPQVAAATTVEWWAHCRPHTSGHQLHFDSDDEGCGGARHPLLSVVLFLGGGGLVGGPTLVTDQLLGGPLASRGWLVGPSDNRLVAFDARVLHGVIPGRGVSPEAARASAQAAAAAARSRSAPGGSCGGNGGAGNGQSVTTSGDGRRVTLMVAFWDRIQVRHAPADAPTDTPGAARPWPNQETTAYTWPRLLEPLAEEQWRQSDAEAASMRLVPPTPVAQVWQPLQPSSSSTQPAEAAAATTVASYSRCFQGI